MADEQLIAADNDKIKTALIQPGGMDALLEEVRLKIEGYEGDATTDKGRKEIASMAYKVARTKTTIDNFGKELVGQAKAEIKKIDDARKQARDTLDDWKTLVRTKLTMWEAEQAKAESEIERIVALGETIVENSEYGKSVIEELQALESEHIPENLRPHYEAVIVEAIERLKESTAARIVREEEIKELERLRNEEAARIAKEKHDAAVAAEAERIRVEAQAKVAAEAAAKAAETETVKRGVLIHEAVESAIAAPAPSLFRKPADFAPVTERIAVSKPSRVGLNTRALAMNEAYRDIVALGVEKMVAVTIVKAISEGKVRNVTITW